MTVGSHKPMLGTGKAYLNHFKQFQQVAKELDNTSVDCFRSGGSMENTPVGQLKPEFIASFGGEKGLTTVSSYTQDSDQIVNVSDTVVGGKDKIGSTLDRDYRDDGTTLKVRERYNVITDVNGTGTVSQTTFSIDKQTGAIAMFDGDQLQQSHFIYS